MYRSTRAVWYVLGAVEALLAFRFLLQMLGANSGAAFTQFIYAASQIFVVPFQFVFGTPAIGASAFEFSTLLAMVVYYLIALGVIKLMLMNRPITRYEAHAGLQDQDV